MIIDFDDADKKVIFASANIDHLSCKDIQSTFPPDCNINLSKNGCHPVFAFYRNKECVSVIHGVDAPQILKQTGFHFPAKQAAVQ